jgi:hypothetical protein
MTLTRRKTVAVCGLIALGGVAAAVALAASPTDLTGVPPANTKSAGYAPASVLSPELAQIAVAQGSTKLENPAGGVGYYGYDNDVIGPGRPAGDGPDAADADRVTQDGAGQERLSRFQARAERRRSGVRRRNALPFPGSRGWSPGYITRISLDADAAHRVTLLGTQDTTGTALSTIDGVTWEPWAQRLLFTTENASAAGVYAATPDYPSTIEDLAGSFGHAGYEGIQDDSDGNLWIEEDVGGANKPSTTARIPNSFVYRFVPRHPGDLKNGKLQVLQVLNASGAPITQASQTALQSPDQLALHVYGSSFRTRWITIHDTAVDGTAMFSANALAKATDGTPFKRPENGVFRPGTDFREFYFDETGDTNATSPKNDCCGGWTSVFKLTQSDPSASTGRLSLLYKGDQAHAGFDNVAFLTKDAISFVVDAGDALHTRRNALESAYILDSPRGVTPLRRSTPARRRPGSARTTATTRSPACTSPTATADGTGSAARGFRTPGTGAATGASSTRSNTATTRPGRSFGRKR